MGSFSSSGCLLVRKDSGLFVKLHFIRDNLLAFQGGHNLGKLGIVHTHADLANMRGGMFSIGVSLRRPILDLEVMNR